MAKVKKDKEVKVEKTQNFSQPERENELGFSEITTEQQESINAAIEEIEGIPTYGKSLNEMIDGSFSLAPTAEVSNIVDNNEPDISKNQLLEIYSNKEGQLLMPDKVSDFYENLLIGLVNLLEESARKAESMRLYALAGEYHNALAAVGMALNKVRAFSPDAINFLNQY